MEFERLHGPTAESEELMLCITAKHSRGAMPSLSLPPPFHADDDVLMILSLSLCVCACVVQTLASAMGFCLVGLRLWVLLVCGWDASCSGGRRSR